MISELRIELGKTKAYVVELKENLNSINKKEINIQTLINLQGRVKNLEKELEKSRKECNKVVTENIRLKKQLFNNQLNKKDGGIHP